VNVPNTVPAPDLAMNRALSKAGLPPSAAALTRTAEMRPGSLTRTAQRELERDADSESPSSEDPVEASARFAREREHALRRSEHSSSVHRLRTALSIGIVVWPLTGLLDWWVTEFAGATDLPRFLLLRTIGAIALLVSLWCLRPRAEPSPLGLWCIDLGMFTLAMVLVSAMCLSFGGIASPYATGLTAILVARGATMVAPWKRGLWAFGIPALSFPVTMLVVSSFDARVAAQWRDPRQVGLFVTSLTFLVTSWLMLTAGGHFAWRLRREALEMRNIGRYKLERRLGVGGMGEVWAAYDRTLKQRVALKTVSGHRPGSQAVARLEREVRALAELTHPNTVRIFDYGVTDDGLWYYAMELLNGENLRELVEREGAMPVPRLMSVARQVLRALGEAHAKGIIHRDIKPENVFVAELGGERDVAKLLDFGIAKATVSGDATLTNTGWFAGTPAYLPPEVIRGLPADVRSDIYSFGATLYFASSGRLPFIAETQQALFEAHLNGTPPPLSQASPLPVSEALEHIVQRCMAKDPSERYGSTQALLEALAEATTEPGV
jgi:eukaryotic-like serine/threonine-protein kinase